MSSLLIEQINHHFSYGLVHGLNIPFERFELKIVQWLLDFEGVRLSGNKSVNQHYLQESRTIRIDILNSCTDLLQRQRPMAAVDEIKKNLCFSLGLRFSNSYHPFNVRVPNPPPDFFPLKAITSVMLHLFT